MVQVASIPWIEAIPFWLLIGFGIVLVAIDIFASNDNHIMWIGGAVIVTGIAKAFGLNGEYVLLVFAATAFAGIVYIRRFVSKLPRLEDQASSVIDLVGAEAIVIDVSNDGEASCRVRVIDHGEWRGIPSSGCERLVPGQRVRVLAREGLVLRVTQLP